MTPNNFRVKNGLTVSNGVTIEAGNLVVSTGYIVVNGATINSSNFSGTANNATYLGGYTWAAPGAIGSGAANTGAFTTLASGNTTITGFANVSSTLQVTGIATFAANVALANNYLIAPVLKAYSEDKTTNATTTGAVTLDLSTTNVFDLTLTGNTTFTFSNPPASTRVFSFSIIAKQDATGGRTITWPSSKKFAGGVAPPATTTANAIDVWSIMTYDGGTSYIISLSVKDAK